MVNWPLCCLSGLSRRLSDFCWLCHSLNSQLKADHSPLPSVVDYLSRSFFVNWPLSSLGPSFPSPLPVSPEISSSSPFFGFRAKTDKEFVCLAHHPHSVTARLKFKLIYSDIALLYVNHYATADINSYSTQKILIWTFTGIQFP